VLRLSFPCASGTKVGDLTDDASQGPEAIRMQIEQSGEAGLIPLEPQGTPARTKRSASCRQRGSTRAKPCRTATALYAKLAYSKHKCFGG
jgi:hypothetical protein